MTDMPVTPSACRGVVRDVLQQIVVELEAKAEDARKSYDESTDVYYGVAADAYSDAVDIVRRIGGLDA